jgi:PhnB protein
VTLEHRGLDRLPQDAAARLEERAWLALMSWFREHVARDKENRMTTQPSLQPPVRQALTPYLCCKGAARALEFYVKVFGGTELTRWTDPSTGTIGHAEVRLADSVLMLADEHPEIGVLSPQSLGGSPVALHLYVADVDAVAREAVAAGGTLLRPVADQEYGERGCKLADPFGHVWMIATRKGDMSLAEIQKRVGSSYEVS